MLAPYQRMSILYRYKCWLDCKRRFTSSLQSFVEIDIFLLSFCLLGRHFVERQNTWPPRCLRTMIMAELSTGSYLFPEIYIHKDNCTLNIMIMVRWGVGVVMYEMMVGRLPFYNRHVFTFCSSSSSQLPSSSVII